MKINLQHDKVLLVEIVDHFLQSSVIGARVELIINGEKTIGSIDKVEFTGEDNNFLVFWVDGNERKIPFYDETKTRLGKEILAFETKNHTTVIEVL